MFYTTIENQVREDGSRGLLYDHFDDENKALAKYYAICSAGAVSGIPYHSAHLLASDGRMLRQEIFERPQEPQPEPQPEPDVDPEE